MRQYVSRNIILNHPTNLSVMLHSKLTRRHTVWHCEPNLHRLARQKSWLGHTSQGPKVCLSDLPNLFPLKNKNKKKCDQIKLHFRDAKESGHCGLEVLYRKSWSETLCMEVLALKHSMTFAHSDEHLQFTQIRPLWSLFARHILFFYLPRIKRTFHRRL